MCNSLIWLLKQAAVVRGQDNSLANKHAAVPNMEMKIVAYFYYLNDLTWG